MLDEILLSLTHLLPSLESDVWLWSPTIFTQLSQPIPSYLLTQSGLRPFSSLDIGVPSFLEELGSL